jgi:putative CocE/NonD family hydrolase
VTRVEHSGLREVGPSARSKGLPLWLRQVLRHLDLPDVPHKRVVQDRDLRASMSDGTVLLADRWRPADEAVAPLVLVRTPYGRRSLNGLLFGRVLAHFGFQVVIQSCRGTQDSGGVFDRPFTAERSDGHDTVAWLRQQPWYPGSFATVGGSYFGYTQLAIATEAGDELAAAVWTAAPLGTRVICYPDDTFSPGTALRWAAQVTASPTAGLKQVLTMRAADKRLRAAAMSAPLSDSYKLATGKGVPFFETWLRADSGDDALWQEQDVAVALDRVNCPVLVQAGWYDIFLDDSLKQFERLLDRGVDARLTVGPWHHVQMTAPAVPDMIAFLTEVLLEGPPRAQGRRVRLIEVGSKKPELLDTWPVPDVEDRAYHLVGGELSRHLPPTDRGRMTTSFTYDPASPTPAVGGALLEPMGSGRQDNRKLESRPDVVTFDTPPLTETLVIRGRPQVSLTFGSDRPATCVFLRLCDAAPDGRSTNLTDLMVPLRTADRAADGNWNVDALLRPVAVRLEPGHRLRLHISSGAFPRFARHPGTAEPVATATTYLPARQTIHHSLARPGYLSVPVAPSQKGLNP